MGKKGDEEAQRAESLPDRVWFTFGMTMNLGDYQSSRIDAGMSTDIRPGEDFDQAMARIQAPIIAEVEKRVDELTGKS